MKDNLTHLSLNCTTAERSPRTRDFKSCVHLCGPPGSKEGESIYLESEEGQWYHTEGCPPGDAENQRMPHPTPLHHKLTMGWGQESWGRHKTPDNRASSPIRAGGVVSGGLKKATWDAVCMSVVCLFIRICTCVLGYIICGGQSLT